LNTGYPRTPTGDIDNYALTVSYGSPWVNPHEQKSVSMNNDDDGGRYDPVRYYGPWAWIAGLLLGALIMWLMFSLADGF